VVDAQGNMVALTQTISDFFGAQGIVIDPKTGLRAGGADPRRDGAVAGY
jgi:gamma-glutamyltranspeptidase